jgi:hypothetical protein
MAPRGGTELFAIGLKSGRFSNDDLPVYPLVYPALNRNAQSPSRQLGRIFSPERIADATHP